MSETLFIGVDCAVDAQNVGLATGRMEGRKLIVTHAECGATWNGIEYTVTGWINHSENSLLALDAPLGWPRPLGEALVTREHMAGDALKPQLDLVAHPKKLKAKLDRMFHRKTEQWIYEEIFERHKKPLGVGEDKIARTGYVALSFLENLRGKTNREIPPAWTPGSVEDVSVIEVYPAATLEGRDIRGPDCRGKRGKEKRDCLVAWRKDVIGRLSNEIKIRDNGIEKFILRSGHVFDAMLCMLAAADFAKGKATAPEDAEINGVKVGLKIAEKEGWIWVRKP